MLRQAWMWAGVVVALGLVGLVGWGALAERALESEDLGARGAGSESGAGERALPSPLLRGFEALPGGAVADAGSGARCVLEGLVLEGGGPAAATVSVARLTEPQIMGFEDAAVPAWGRRMLAPVLGEADQVARLASGADGRFRVDGLAPGVYRLDAESAGRCGGAVVALSAAGERREVRLDLVPAGQRLVGRARWSDGRPFLGLVEVTDMWGEPRPSQGGRQVLARTVATDAQGRFIVEQLPRGWAYLAAFEPGAWRSALDWVGLPYAGVYEFVVDQHGGALAGRVLDARTDAPLPDALVLLASASQDRGVCLALRSGPDGEFSAPCAPSEGSLWVRCQGYGLHRRASVRTDQPLVVRMHRGAHLVGSVTDVEGVPVAGLEVRLAGADWPGSTRTDRDGRYRLSDLAPGSTRVLVDGGGWAPSHGACPSTQDGEQAYDPCAVDLWPGETREVDVVVEQGRRIAVSVVGADGLPAPGVLVLLHGGDTDPRRDYEQATSHVVAGPDGKGCFHGLLEQHYTLYAQQTGGGWVQARAQAGSDAVPEPVVLRLGAARWIDVEAVDGRTGAPLPGVSVDRAVTGADGRARAGPFGPDKSQIHVWADGYVSAWRYPVPEVAGPAAPGPDERLRVELWPSGPVRGTVRFPDGRPAEGMRMNSQSRREDPRWLGWQNRSQADGSFELQGIRDTPLQLSAAGEAEGYAWSATLAIDGPGAGLVLTLQRGDPVASKAQPAVAFTLRVVDERGRAVAQAEILSTLGDPRRPAPGVFEWSELPSETAVLEIRRPRDDSGVALPLAVCVAGPFGASERDVTVRLEEERVVTGFVVDEEGLPVAGVGVRAVAARVEARPPERFREKALAFTRSDSRGGFRLGGLRAEPYVLRIAAPPGRFPPRRIVVDGGDEGVEIRLRSRRPVSVHVVDEDSRPVPGARVECRLERWLQNWRSGVSRTEAAVSTAHADVNGVALLSDLDPEQPYTLRVHETAWEAETEWGQLVQLQDMLEGYSLEDLDGRDDPRYGPAEPVLEADWLPRDTRVVLRSASGIAGMVVDEHGRPCPDARICVRPLGGEWSSDRCAHDGTFALALRGPGPFELAGGGGNASAPHPRASIVRARQGAEHLRVPRGRFGRLDIRLDGTSGLSFEGTHGLISTLLPELPGSGGASACAYGTHNLQFHDLDESCTYTLWIRARDGGLVALLRGVRAALHPLDVRLEAELRIGGRYRAPRTATELKVRAIGPHPGIVVEGRLTIAGGVEIGGLAPGRWTVVATGRDAGRELEARAEVEAGEDVRLNLAPR